MPWIVRSAVLFLGLLIYAAPAAAIEPLFMFLLNAASQMIEQAALRPVAPAPVPLTYPGTTVAPQQLKAVIDESFSYLSSRQRQEIFASFNRELLKPRNAALRGAMIGYFVHRAAQLRAAQLSLARLSTRDKQALAVSFGKQIATLPPQERSRLRGLIEGHLLPVPDDLNAMLLAQVEQSAPSAATAAPPRRVGAQ